MDTANENGKRAIKSEKLAESTVAWNGSLLPRYPEGEPKVTILKITLPPHAETDTHFHELINCGVVVKGVLTVVNEDCTEHDFHAGEAIIETVGTIHHGENRGEEDVELIMFYAGDASTPLSTPA